MPPAQFFRERQAELEKYQEKFRPLRARWHVSNLTWRLYFGESVEGVLDPPQEALRAFKSIARTIVAGWPETRSIIASSPYPHVAANAEPWEVWLDFMRVRGWGFRVIGLVRCTEREWDACVKDGKALYAVRRKLKYTTFDEDRKLYRRLPDGSLKRLSAKELKEKGSEELLKYYHWLEDGVIEHVFPSSALLCGDLFSCAFELEAGGARTATTDPAPPPTGHAPPAPPAASAPLPPTPADPAAGGTDRRSPFPNRAAWLKARLRERGWSKHDLERNGGPEHRTTQKILDELPVQDDVLRRVIIGLQSKLKHKGRDLPPISESDIPNS
jgi:hypothetical protein